MEPDLSALAAEAADLYRRDLAAVAGIEKLRFFPLAAVSGEGSWLVEAGGRRILDLTSTWTASGLGYGHPAVVEAVTRAVQSPPGSGGLSSVHPDSVGLAEELLALTPGEGERRVYLGHAGSDACDVALRAVRLATGKRTIIAFEHSYHGGVGVALGASGVHIEAGANEADPDVIFVPYPNPYRPPAGEDPAAAALAVSLAAIDTALARGDVAAMIVEPFLADGGMVVPPDGFLRGCAERCRTAGVPLIVDEVKVGLGRSGMLHAFQIEGIVPDVVCFGKVLGGGLPLSACVGPAWILDGPPATALLTTAGNPICAAVGRAVLRTLVDEELPARARAAGERLRAGLRAADLPQIGDVRGHGLSIGCELVEDRATKVPSRTLAAKTVYRAFELGAAVFYVGGNTLEITPPLVITDEEVDRGVEVLVAAITDAAAGRVPDELVAPYAGW
ncbi:MAG: aspartate aminotransferase family protein [Acidobacteriota bacterium]|nr:aspartate aminotransferase family protein [Acidobacteriota bacterium]MDE3082621.1 aspartate aminotransferase family protein [Acidobacteriota bacterium]